MGKRIVIIDGNSLINRAYYAMQRPMITSDGTYTQGIYGFINMLNRIIQDNEPDYMAVAWDLKAPTFRHKEYADYKAGRHKMPIELAMEIPIMKEILAAMNISNLELEGFEADDIIGTLANMSEAEGLEPLIITGDKDALQLASDKVKVLITRKGITEFDLYDRNKMVERYELTPEQFVDLKGLMGDQSDNIPGIPGVGEKTGIKLLKQFNTVEELIRRSEEIDSPKLKEKVQENYQLALMSKRLAKIVTDAPIEVDFQNLKFKDPDKNKLVDIYKRLEFNSFLKKLAESAASPNGGKKNTNESGGMGMNEGSPQPQGEVATFNPDVTHFIIIKNEQDAETVKLEKEVFIKVIGDGNHVEKPDIRGVALISGNEGFYFTGENGIKSLVEIINGQKPSLCGHGIKDDIYSLMVMGLRDICVSFDTEVAQYVLEPSRSKYGIQVLMLEAFHYELPDEKFFLEDNGQLDLLGDGDKKLAEYGILLCNSSKALKEIQEKNLKERNLLKVFNEAEMPLVEVLASMEKEGFRVDEKTLDYYGKEMETEITSLTSDIYEIAGTEFNINSPAQLGEVLFDKMGLPAGKKTKTGYSTGAEVLEKLRDKSPIIDKILRFRTLSKLKSTYVDGLKPLIGNDNKIHAHFMQTVTATGRISCTEPNLQNIPVRDEYGRQLRKAFIPRDEEHVLIGADYSQIELRVLAHLSGDEGLIQAFNEGADIHRATAARVFGLEYDKVSSLDRSRAKAVNFGVIYGMSGFGLSEELGISRWDAERYIEDYFSKHQKVKDYMDRELEFCKKNGFTETILGRRRYIPEINAPNKMVRNLGERLAMNSPIQGSAADIIKLAMIKVYHKLKDEGFKSKLILQVHDELIIDALKSEQEAVSKLLVESMQSAMKLSVELESDLNSGTSWYDLKD